MAAVTQLLDAALRYAARGWPVFPCRPRLKIPATGHGVKDATTDPGLIGAWWEQWPEANIGVATGSRSRLVVLDVDGAPGLDSLCKLEAAHEPLHPTATVDTPRGGIHFYLQHPGREVRNSAGKLGPGLDVRGDGGYVLAPPSTVSGCAYRVRERAAIAPATDWLLNLLSEPQNARRRAPATDWLSLVRDGLTEGARNDGLARIVGHLLRRYVDVDLVAEIAHLINTRGRPPLDSAEVDRIVESVAGLELRRRQRKAVV